MKTQVQQWLSEIRSDGLIFSGNSDGAVDNLWCISIPYTVSISAGELVSFLVEAASIRRNIAVESGILPTTFYAWYDEMAGQLRFSTAQCAPDKLPFGAAISLVESPHEIVQDFIDSPYREGIPWAELREISASESNFVEEINDERHVVKVWAQQLTP